MIPLLSTIVFNPTCTDEVRQLVKDITPLLHATRDDWIETRDMSRPLADSEESTLYVIVHTGNLLGMIADLRDKNIL